MCVKHSDHVTHTHTRAHTPPALPAGRAQSCDPGLEDSGVEREGAFSGDAEKYGGQDQAAVDQQAHHDGHHVHTQLPGHHLQVSDGGYLPGDERGDANGRVPEDRVALMSPPTSATHRHPASPVHQIK